MAPLPDAISSVYRPACTREVYSWSFGAIRTVRNPAATEWSEKRFTLDDEAIFGPTRDYLCTCGKYRGRKHDRRICDRCGTKVTTSRSRRIRFGHIDLPSPVRHPLGDACVPIEAFPVMPAAFRESPAGRVLDPLYESVLHHLSPFDAEAVTAFLGSISDVLLPIIQDSMRWNLDEANLLARGGALVPRRESEDGRCSQCGFPLTGLRVSECPGCGRKLTAD